jgi:asparagine synthase (glutamine-hydrolysing)
MLMSALAAVVTRAGADPGVDARALIERMRGRGPDHVAMACDGPAALGFALLRTLPEDAPGAQPATDRVGRCLVVLDGRLDNRQELADACGLTGRGRTDAALVAEAWSVGGESILSTLLGDYALVVWDKPRRALFAARDVFGRRPLYVRQDDRAVTLASELQAIARGSALPINEGMVAETLAGGITSLTDTVYAGVSRLKPGWVLRVEGDRITTSRAVSFSIDRAPRRDAEWAEELRVRLTAAVRARLRAVGRPGVLLSGGIDSGSILTAAVTSGAAVTAWTIDWPKPATETTRARETAGALGVSHTVVPPSAGDYDYAASARAALDRAAHPGGANSMGVRRAAASAGARVLLTGVGGDEVLGTNAWHAADLLRAGRMAALVRAWRTLAATTDPPTRRELWQATLAPFVPRALAGLARRASGLPDVPPWIARPFAERMSLADRLRARDVPRADTIAGCAQLWHACGGGIVAGLEETDRLAAESTTDDRSPFLDRRIVELALAAPAHLVAVARESKQLLREALADRLPLHLRRPVPALDYQPILLQALDRIGGAAFFRHLRAEEAGWVNGAWVRDRVASVWPVVGPPDWNAASALWNVAAVELWLKNL